jgi:hypothetical protein
MFSGIISLAGTAIILPSIDTESQSNQSNFLLEAFKEDVIFSNDTTLDSSIVTSAITPDEVEGSLASIMNTVADEDWFESI